MLTGRRAQVWHHHPSFRRPAHFHAEPELNVVTRGHGVLTVGRECFEVRAGDAVYFQPGQDHALLNESPDFELFVLALHPDLAERCALSEVASLGVVSLPEALVASSRAAWLGLGPIREASVVEHQLCEHFTELAAHFTPAPALCRRTIRALRRAPEATEEQIAAQLVAHPSEVSRSVRRTMGMRLVEFRTRFRLMEFIESVDGGASLTRAAFASGFGSYSQLHRVFRQHLGCSPLDYFAGHRERVSALVEREAPEGSELDGSAGIRPGLTVA